MISATIQYKNRRRYVNSVGVAALPTLQNSHSVAGFISKMQHQSTA